MGSKRNTLSSELASQADTVDEIPETEAPQKATRPETIEEESEVAGDTEDEIKGDDEEPVGDARTSQMQDDVISEDESPQSEQEYDEEQTGDETDEGENKVEDETDNVAESQRDDAKGKSKAASSTPRKN